MQTKKMIFIMSFLLFVFGITGCGKTEPVEQATEVVLMEGETFISDETEEAETTEVETETEPVFEEYDITLMAIGDNLMHMGIVNTGRMEDGSYNYTFLFDGIADQLAAADIKIINQETIFGGNHLGFSGYPYFNSPTEVGDAIAAAGFNVVLQASNHSADQGIEGLKYAATFWENHPEVLMTGIHLEAAETHDIPLLTVEDVTFAVLNYTYGPNMEVLPSNIQGHLDMLCNWDVNTGNIDFTTIHPQVLADIEKASEIADVVIVCPHWGTEYVTMYSDYQKEFAQQMTQAGADLIIGTHPHVCQPVEWVQSENGNRALCYYSLGNYVSTQQDGICMLEGMAWVNFRVKEDGVEINEETTGVFPMVCQYKSGPLRLEDVYFLEYYTDEYTARHGIRNWGGVNLTVSDLQTWSQEIFGDWELSVSDFFGESTVLQNETETEFSEVAESELQEP